MRAGDTCVITTNGVRSGTMSVSQQLAAEHNDGLGSIAGGVLLLAVGGIVVGKRGKRGQRAMATGSHRQASFPPGPSAAAGEPPGRQPDARPSAPTYAQPENLGYGHQQGWAQPLTPQQSQYPRQ